jgi:hypothetical protein
MDADAVNLALLALRVAGGAVMFAHGWNHLARMREAGCLQLVREPRAAPGPGPRGISLVDGWSGFATTAIAGLGGAVALLVLFWRPPREETA